MNAVQQVGAQAKVKVERARARFGLVDIVLRVFKRFSEDDGGSYSAALTYYLFFSLFPLLLFAASLLGYITFGNHDLQHRIFSSGLRTIPMLKDALSPNGVSTLQSARGPAAIIALVLALYSGTGVIVALQHALNKIHHATGEPNFLQKRLRALKWLAVLGVAAVASLAITTVTQLAGPLAAVLGIAGGLALNVGIFMTAFRFLPVTDNGWKEVFPGACVAAVVFELLKLFGALYLEHGSKARNDTFGALAGAATLLVASYLLAQVILLSAEVNAVIRERRLCRTDHPTSEEAT
ncbi:MAG: YihY/virulence factor BrkB family protein [Actinomycetota bacterium]|nr:YihY/virulence factor BrkB family protein [Actinomycetota bacterium]